MQLKVVKFGGTSLADAEHFIRVAEIIKADPSRRYVVASAPGKRSGDDIKVTDMLYTCYNMIRRHEDITEYYNLDYKTGELSKLKDYTLSEENLIVLDHAAWETENTASNGAEYIILADDKFRSMIGEMPRGGLMEQPWHRGRKEIEKSIRLTLTFSFECDTVPAENCILSMENPEKFTIFLNNNEIKQNISGFYLDRDIKNIEINRKRNRFNRTLSD